MPSHDPPPASLEVSPATVEKSPVLAVTPWSTEHSIPTLPTSTIPSEQPRSAPTAPRTGKLKNVKDPETKVSKGNSGENEN